MAWNEPGGGKDPWGGGQGDGPPDLDEALKKIREKFSMFGVGSGSSSGGGGEQPGSIKGIAVTLLVILAAVWLFMSVYQVDEKERAVVLRFGKFHEVVSPGLHINPKLIDTVIIEATTEERQYRNNRRDLMLTEDENIVAVQLAVQYNIKDIKDYVLKVKNPETSLQHATDSALRHIVGSADLDSVISSGREEISLEVKDRLQLYLDNYETGINVVKINIQDAKPPSNVKEAYDDVIKAREDQERVINEAQSYSNGIIPEARGRAKRIEEESEAYKEKVIAEAVGEANRFEKLLTEYDKAPDVTRERLYLDAIQEVMGNTTKVMINAGDGNNIMYLPLDKAMNVAPGGSTGGQRLSPAQITTIAEAISNQINSQSGSASRRDLRQ